MKLLHRILTLLIVTAYVGATTLQVAPTYAANADMRHTAMGGMMHEQDSPGDKMPCKGMLPGCVTDLGCIFLVSLPGQALVGTPARKRRQAARDAGAPPCSANSGTRSAQARI